MLITFKCTECQTSLEVDTSATGSEVECPQCGAAQVVPRTKLGPGTTVGGFRIKRLLGKGGMGEVYLARQLSMDRDVALKILPTSLTMDEEAVARFLQEVRMAARLEHPNIVTAHEAGEDSGVYYLAMSYVKGDTLGDLLADYAGAVRGQQERNGGRETDPGRDSDHRCPGQIRAAGLCFGMAQTDVTFPILVVGRATV